jgi:4'-phosphopantetheinyl transferase
VGVAIEEVVDDVLAKRLAPSLHHREETEILGAPEDVRGEMFTQIWTRKNAYLKGAACVSARDMGSTYLGLVGRVTAAGDWSVESLLAPDGYAAAIAVQLN